MSVRFLHMADVHLGNQQYNLSARFNDFGRAFLDAVDLALDQRVDAVLIAGDLFHKATVEPKTLLIAEEGLARLQARGIAALAVHGNHDRARYLAQASWVDYLAERGLVRLLSPVFVEGGLLLEPETSYIELDGVRFVGVPWLGAAAPRVLREVAVACADLNASRPCFTVLITHGGVEGQMPHMPGGLTFAELEPLKGIVQYLALGHLHKPYCVDDWIYNPGSLETCSFDEAQYERGVYLVDVTGRETHIAEHRRTAMRPFFTINVQTDLCLTPDDLVAAARAEIAQAARKIRPVVDQCSDRKRALPVVRLVLRGNLTFDRTRLEADVLHRMMRDEIEALHSRVENHTSPLKTSTVNTETLGRNELEKAIFEDQARGDSRFAGQAEAWGNLMQAMKALVLDGADPAAVYDLLDGHMAALEDGGHVDH